LNSDGEEVCFTAVNLIQDDAESSGFLYLSKHDDSHMLMASGVEGATVSTESRKNLSSPRAGPVCSPSGRGGTPRNFLQLQMEQCRINCESSDEGQENVEYCEEDEAKLHPEDHNITLEERIS